MSDKIRELLLKLKALAESGIDGEKKSAENMLSRFLKKHNLSLDDLHDTERMERVFKIKEKTDAPKIFAQCVWDVVPDSEITEHEKNLQMYCKLNNSEYLEVSEKFNHYYNAWLNEKKQFMTAFILKNSIGIKESSGSSMSDDDVKGITQKLDYMVKHDFENKKLKQLKQ